MTWTTSQETWRTSYLENKLGNLVSKLLGEQVTWRASYLSSKLLGKQVGKTWRASWKTWRASRENLENKSRKLGEQVHMWH